MLLQSIDRVHHSVFKLLNPKPRSLAMRFITAKALIGTTRHRCVFPAEEPAEETAQSILMGYLAMSAHFSSSHNATLGQNFLQGK